MTNLKVIKQRNTKMNLLIEQNIDEINKLYDQGLSLSKIALKLNISYISITKLFKNNNVKIRDKNYYARKYPLNEHYFDVIDTEEKAYILGFIYADGNNLFSDNRISIKLSIVDKEILQNISNILYGLENLGYFNRINDEGKEFQYVYITAHSKHMSKQLNTLGVMERKSLKITFPQWLNKSLYQPFIRGLIDGDGWIYLPKNNRDSPNVGLISTRPINDFIYNFLEQDLQLKSYLCKVQSQDFNVMCEIRVKNYHRCKIFLDWLYKDSTVHLKRKFDLYQNFLERYNKLRKQNQ